MKNLKFKSASAYNFLPFGPEGIEISFEDLGNIILVRGQNMDQEDSSLKEPSAIVKWEKDQIIIIRP